MIVREWHFRLDGDELDVNSVAELFRTEVKIVKDANGRNELLIDLEFTNDQSFDAEKVAEDLIAKLNAIAQVVHGYPHNVRIGRIACKDPSTGGMKYFIRAEAAMVRFRCGFAGLGTTEHSGVSHPVATAPNKIGDRMLAAADVNDDLARALHIFGSQPLDWRTLANVLEAAEDGNGGEKGLINKKWVADGQIKAFKGDVNNFTALGVQARHGTVNAREKPKLKSKLTFEEAREMVRTILERWLEASI